MEQQGRLPLIGEKAPSFEEESTQGPVRFPHDFKGKWVIFFSRPADFTPVCTTEFMTFASMLPEFEKLNCKRLGLSIESTYSHIAWLRTIKEKIEFRGVKDVEVTFPVISDLSAGLRGFSSTIWNAEPSRWSTTCGTRINPVRRESRRRKPWRGRE